MSSRKAGYVVAWVVAATLAVAIGIAAVSTVGASIRGRGPLGNEVVRDLGPADPVTPDVESSEREDTFTGDFGEFVVACRGVAAYGRDARPAPGWGIVSYEQGPDDDVDAVFANSRLGRSVEMEVICNRGRPTLDDIEDNTLPDEDD